MSKIKEEEIIWLSESYINRDCKSQSFKHYKKVKTPNLVVEIGDCVLISNADEEEECHVARVVSLYEDTSNKICPYKCKVQWYTRPKDLPTMDRRRMHFLKTEVVEDHRPYSTDVSLEALVKKCIISFERISPTPFDYLCRYRLMIVNKNTGKCAIEAITQANQGEAEMLNVSTLDPRTSFKRKGKISEQNKRSVFGTVTGNQSRDREMSPVFFADTDIDRQSRNREISQAFCADAGIAEQSLNRDISQASCAEAEIAEQSLNRDISQASCAEIEIAEQSLSRDISKASCAEAEIAEQSLDRDISQASCAEAEIAEQSLDRDISQTFSAEAEIAGESRNRDISQTSSAEKEIVRQSRKRNILHAFSTMAPIAGRLRSRGISPVSSIDTEIDEQALNRAISPASSTDTDNDRPFGLTPSLVVKVESMETGREIFTDNLIPKGRERHMEEIFSYLKSKVISRGSGCMYISGGTGSGKTITIAAALIKLLNENEMPRYRILKFSGRKYSDPTLAYVKIYERITGITIEWEVARSLLDKKFKTPRNSSTIIVLDEIDNLLEQHRREVILNLMHWTTSTTSLLTVVVVGNLTKITDSNLFPEGFETQVNLFRQYFMPYTYMQLYAIINRRMRNINITTNAVHLLVRKLGPVTGDARHALEICERVIELAGRRKAGEEEVERALGQNFFNTVHTIRQCSYNERLILRAVAEEVRQTSNHETNLNRIVANTKYIANTTHYYFNSKTRTPTPSQALSICSRLASQRLLLLHPRRGDLKIYLNVSVVDVFRATTPSRSRFLNIDPADV